MANPTAADWKKDLVYLEDWVNGIPFLSHKSKACKPPEPTTWDEFVKREAVGQCCWALSLVLAAQLLLQG